MSMVHKIDGSQEKTIIDFINVTKVKGDHSLKPNGEVYINNDTFTTTETYEPSIGKKSVTNLIINFGIFS
jgi:hypothetical protein